MTLISWELRRHTKIDRGPLGNDWQYKDPRGNLTSLACRVDDLLHSHVFMFSYATVETHMFIWVGIILSGHNKCPRTGPTLCKGGGGGGGGRGAT